MSCELTNRQGNHLFLRVWCYLHSIYNRSYWVECCFGCDRGRNVPSPSLCSWHNLKVQQKYYEMQCVDYVLFLKICYYFHNLRFEIRAVGWIYFKVPKCNILSVTLEILVIWRTNEIANFIPGWVGDKSGALYALQIRWKGLSNLHSSLQYAAIKKILGCGCVPFSFIWFNH